VTYSQQSHKKTSESTSPHALSAFCPSSRKFNAYLRFLTFLEKGDFSPYPDSQAGENIRSLFGDTPIMIMSNLLRSLAMSTIVSFSLPMLAVGTLLLSLSLASHIPGVGFIGEMGSSQVLRFLTIFGSGYPLHGILSIGLAFAVAGSLFDLFNFYIHQGNRGE
jgi:hypothetical protein